MTAVARQRRRPASGSWRSGAAMGEPTNPCQGCDGHGLQHFDDEDLGPQARCCDECDGTGIDRTCTHCGAIGEWNDNAGDYLCGSAECYREEIRALASDQYFAKRLRATMLDAYASAKQTGNYRTKGQVRAHLVGWLESVAMSIAELDRAEADAVVKSEVAS